MGLVPKQYEKPVFWAVAILGGLALFNIYKKGVSGVTSDLAQSAVNLATGAASGVVVGVGKAAGLPATNPGQCALDMANGDNWAASKSCDAVTFLKWQAAGVKYNLDKLKDLI